MINFINKIHTKSGPNLKHFIIEKEITNDSIKGREIIIKFYIKA